MLGDVLCTNFAFSQRHTDEVSGISCLVVSISVRRILAAVDTLFQSPNSISMLFQQEALLNALVLSLYIIIYYLKNHWHSIFEVSCFKFVLLYKTEV